MKGLQLSKRKNRKKNQAIPNNSEHPLFAKLREAYRIAKAASKTKSKENGKKAEVMVTDLKQQIKENFVLESNEFTLNKIEYIEKFDESTGKWVKTDEIKPRYFLSKAQALAFQFLVKGSFEGIQPRITWTEIKEYIGDDAEKALRVLDVLQTLQDNSFKLFVEMDGSKAKQIKHTVILRSLYKNGVLQKFVELDKIDLMKETKFLMESGFKSDTEALSILPQVLRVCITDWIAESQKAKVTLSVEKVDIEADEFFVEDENALFEANKEQMKEAYRMIGAKVLKSVQDKTKSINTFSKDFVERTVSKEKIAKSIKERFSELIFGIEPKLWDKAIEDKELLDEWFEEAYKEYIRKYSIL